MSAAFLVPPGDYVIARISHALSASKLSIRCYLSLLIVTGFLFFFVSFFGTSCFPPIGTRLLFSSSVVGKVTTVLLSGLLHYCDMNV